MCNRGNGSGEEARSRQCWPSTEEDAYTDSSSGVENNGAPNAKELENDISKPEKEKDHNTDDVDARELNKLYEHKDLLNYYQLLRIMYDRSLASADPERRSDERSASCAGAETTAATTESTIDLTISKSSTTDSYGNNININIDHGARDNIKSLPSNDCPKSPATPSPTAAATVRDNITINSAGMSINVSNSPNELKISCKTTPPKKRFSRGFEENQESVATTEESLERNNNDQRKATCNWQTSVNRKMKEFRMCDKGVSVSIFR